MEDQLGPLRAAFVANLEVKGYSTASRKAYGLHIDGFLAFLRGQGVLDVRRVGKDLLKTYEAQVALGQTKTGKPYGWGTKCLKIRSVKRLFEWLEDTQKILVNPAEFIKEPKRPSRLPGQILTSEQVERVLDQADLTKPEGIRDRAILEVFYSTGIRLGELRHLTLLDIDLGNGLLRVNQGKGGKDRVVPLGEMACRFLKEYLTKVRPHLLAAKSPQQDNQVLFLNHWGGPLSKTLIEHMVSSLGQKAGVRISPHSFRHACATQLVRNGADISVVSKLLGHSRLEITQVYTKVAGVEMKQTHGKAHPREKEKAEIARPEIEAIRRQAG